MKIFALYICLFLLTASNSWSQFNITDPDSDQSSPIVCANYQDDLVTNFFDDGGAGANYSASFNDTLTLCPDVSNGVPKLQVTMGNSAGYVWDVDGGDTLYVYDGPDVNSPLLGAYNSSNSAAGFSHIASWNNLSGCLTFVFISNGNTETAGWEGNISCVSPPQPFEPHVEAFINGTPGNDLDPLDTGYVDVCQGDSILLVAKPDFPNSLENTGTGYSQNINNVDYLWEFSDGFTGPNNDSIWYTPSSNDGFFVELRITDQFPQTFMISFKIRVSQTPSFAGTGPEEDTVCFNQETNLLGGTSATDTVGVDFPGGTFNTGGFFAGLTFLPDGSNNEYTTTIDMNGFAPGSTVQNPSDIQSLCIDIEHSWLGDLEMWLECPNGTEVEIFNSYTIGYLPGGFGGGGTFLGEPLDNTSGTPGNGYTYCFSSVNNTWGDFETEHTNGNFINLTSPPAPSAGSTMNPNGVYLPEQTFADLAGCPLNGPWTIHVQDNILADDGYIFEWSIDFDSQLFPDSETYQNSIINSYWSPDPAITSGLSGDTTITVNPNTPGDHDFTFNVEDDFGCFYDTTVTLHVLDTVAIVNSLDTTVFCATDSIPLWTTASGLEPFTYTWADGQVGDTSYQSVSSNGTYEYYVTITDDCGIETIDTATITMNQTLTIDSLNQFPADCGIPNGAVAGFGDGYTGTPDFQWSGPGLPAPDSVDASVWQNLSSGWYYFTIEDDVCSVEDSIFLEQDPPPTASFDANPQSGNAPLDVTFTNTSDPAVTYDWDFGNGQTNSVNNQDDQFMTYTDEGTYTVTLTITDGNCTDQASQVINVELILPLTYDIPNVFTPNGDNTNDLFTINAQNVESLEVVILNRWGNVVFESTDVNFEWNGQVQNDGAECVDGTYFYKLNIKGEGEQEAEEHGFVQLVRDTDK